MQGRKYGRHPVRRVNLFNPDGSRKSIDQMLRATLKVAAYGAWLASQSQQNTAVANG